MVNDRLLSYKLSTTQQSSEFTETNSNLRLGVLLGGLENSLLGTADLGEKYPFIPLLTSISMASMMALNPIVYLTTGINTPELTLLLIPCSLAKQFFF